MRRIKEHYNRSAPSETVAWWTRVAGHGTTSQRIERLFPHVVALFNEHLGPPQDMSDRELGRRWRSLLARNRRADVA